MSGMFNYPLPELARPNLMPWCNRLKRLPVPADDRWHGVNDDTLWLPVDEGIEDVVRGMF